MAATQPSVILPVNRPTGEKTAMIRAEKRKRPYLKNSEIARKVGCDPALVHRVLKDFLGPSSVEDLKEFQTNKADIFDAMQLRIHKSINDADIAKAPLLARVTAGAILEDKARTIRGQATQVNVTLLLDAVSAIREMRGK
eukprot:gnl/Spiro4/1982_TR945_c0_g1_i1.p6 gnl/Spiro4/1982_TR945_c0_g1~~gnl/Spiro4/1982_TR945_c0_g1_i1.p6  ORF type:complete len:140 (-),score=13.54 gnl/Spiro4/1982_TR945_c0_g1_i1:182-601(-)